ncbi:MAG: hypothetical protein A2Z99_15385 [Treponema sp. GWB1_62_6]|nr:MAG: hypothetical protein A2Z99_15385 [Treponema sp. GWB1_62_6]
MRGSALPLPTPMFAGFLLVAVLSLFVGSIRKEQAAVTLGACFMAVAAYAFVSVLLASLFRLHPAESLRSTTAPRELSPDEPATLSVFAPRRFLPPGVALSYEIELRTMDGRVLTAAVDPERVCTIEFSAPFRGAYFASFDTFRIHDGFGLFQASHRIPSAGDARLLVMPGPHPGQAPEQPRQGGTEERKDASFKRTDDFTDNRKYAPGDDPRRINWKLYGHSGELFLREGEIEPPPKARYLILLDATADPALFDREDAAFAVDALAERALGAFALAVSLGFEADFAFNGSPVSRGTPKEAARAFSYPAAVSPLAAASLPVPGESIVRTILFALPRTVLGDTALDRFLKEIRGGAQIDLRFVLPAHPVITHLGTLRSLVLRPAGPSGRKPARMHRAKATLRETVLSANLAAHLSGNVHARRSQD